MGILNFKQTNLIQMATPEEQAIQGVIDQIWDTYDVDKSGALDKEETKKFVQDTLGNLGSGDEFSDEAFDEVFATFDKDGSGTVENPASVWRHHSDTWRHDTILSCLSTSCNTCLLLISHKHSAFQFLKSGI